MPIYAFVCVDCGKHFEELCTLTESESVRCPDCGARAKRRISSFAFKSSGGFHGGDGSGCSGCHSGNCSSCGG